MTTKEFVSQVEAALKETERAANEALARGSAREDVRYQAGFYCGVIGGVHRLIFALAPNEAAKIAARLLCAEYDERLDELIRQHYERVKRAA